MDAESREGLQGLVEMTMPHVNRQK